MRDLNLRSALEFYGISFNRQGAALCPFHSEKTASFRVKEHYWHCFGCGESGDLITFIRKLLGTSYSDALRVICKDFNIATAQSTIVRMETVDKLKLERYNIIRHYAELLKIRDICIDIYLFACDVLEYVVQYTGKDLDNDKYVDATYAVLNARNALEQVEYECWEYLRENPSATPQPPSCEFKHTGIRLPPSPRFRNSIRTVASPDAAINATTLTTKEVKKYD